MKKIVGILAAAAIATSVFAVDFSAGFQLKANLFEYNGASESISAFKLWNENTKDDKPFIFSISDDRVGATLKFFDACGDVKYGKAGEYEVDTNGKVKVAEASAKGSLPSIMSAHAYNIWFKPFDMLRIDLGCQDIALNKEHVTWWKGNIVGGKLNGWNGIGEWGYKATVNVDAFTVAVAFLAADDTPWMSKAKDLDAEIGETTLYAEYAADFGKINFIFDAKSTFKDLKIAAGYSNKFGDVEIFADAMIAMVKPFKDADFVNAIAIDFDARTNIDAIGLEAYFNWAAPLKDMKKDNMRVATYAKASYALNGGSLFLKIEDDNLIAEKFAADFTLGYDGNLGAMAYEVAALISIAPNAAGDSKVTFGLPCYFRIGF